MLLNNGIYQGPGVMDRFLELSEADLRRVFEGNVFAQLHLTRRVLEPMLERGSGIVINMSSTAGRTSPERPTGEGGWGLAYGTSKGAFHRVAGLLHAELRDLTTTPGPAADLAAIRARREEVNSEIGQTEKALEEVGRLLSAGECALAAAV